MDQFGYTGKILRVNLENRRCSIEKSEDGYYQHYLGGRGIIVHTLLTEIPAGADPLGAENKIIFAGDGSAKCVETFTNQNNASFLEDFNPSGAFMATLSEKKFNNQAFEDVAYFEPFYLKDFVAGLPKVKGLRM